MSVARAREEGGEVDIVAAAGAHTHSVSSEIQCESLEICSYHGRSSVRDARVLEASSSISLRRAERNESRASMFHWGKWKKRMGANSSSKRPVFDDKEDGEEDHTASQHHTDSMCICTSLCFFTTLLNRI